MTLLSDERIIEAVILGDVEMYSELVERYQNNIYNIGMRFFRNEDDAKDFTQDVFIKAFKNLVQFKGRSSFKYWLVRVAYNYGISSIKRRKDEINVNEDTIIDNYTGPEERHFNSELKSIINEAVEKLPDKYKVCVDMYFFLGLSYREISLISEIPVNTIKSHVLRAKQQLRDFLKGTMAEDYYDK